MPLKCCGKININYESLMDTEKPCGLFFLFPICYNHINKRYTGGAL